MSKKNKVVKLGSKNREHGRKGLVVYNGVEMTRAQRESFLRAQANERPADAKASKARTPKKGTKVAEPRHSKLFNLLHPNKKQTVVPDLKSVDISSYNSAREAAAKQAEVESVKKPDAKASEPVVAREAVAETPIKAIEPPCIDVQSNEEQDDFSLPISRSNAKKRISPSFVKRVGTVSARSCDELILEDARLASEIALLDESIAKAKTPKGASDELKAQLNQERKELRAQKSKLVAKRDVNRGKAVALEKASDGYCDIYRLLTGNELSLRKTDRMNEYVPLSEQEEQEILDSLWAGQRS